MADSKFQGPSVGKDVDPGKVMKLAMRVQKALTDLVVGEPKQLDPRSVLVAPLNRDGAPPNCQHIHHQILKTIITKGFDKTRPSIGICVEFKSEKAKKQLLAHNQRFSKGQNLLPTIVPEMALYGSLAGSHLNLALRLIQAGASSPVGNLADLCDEQPALKEVVTSGHKWWILPEETAKTLQTDISLWRNQDQNENQSTHEVEIMQSLLTTAESLAEPDSAGTQNTKMNIGDLVARAGRRNPAKISPQTMQTFAKYFLQFLNSGDVILVKELIDFHSTFVNPRELVVSGSFYKILTDEEILLKYPYLRHYLILTQYTTEKAKQQTGGPCIAQFLEAPAITALVKKAETLATCEKTIRDLRDKYLPILNDSCGEKQAHLMFASYMILLIRCLLAKPWPENLSQLLKGITTGKFSAEKIDKLGCAWSKFVDKEHPGINFSRASGLYIHEATDDADEDMEVNLKNLKSLKRTASEPLDSDLVTFKIKDEVTVIRRMSWQVPRAGKKDFRKDVAAGVEGVIVGFADAEHTKVLLKVILNGSEVIHEAAPRNLKLTTEYLLAKAGSAVPKEEPADSTGPSKVKSNVPVFVRGETPVEHLRNEASWDKLLSDYDKANQVFFLKARIGVCLEALNESLPTYTAQDLYVINRGDSKGNFKTEIWTRRDFGPQELCFAPATYQIKDTHLTLQANASLGIPRSGPGAHPDNQALALDGRGLIQMAKKDSCSASEHRGSLYWCVSRSDSNDLASMTLESVSFDYNVNLTMPLKKKKISYEWLSKDLPSLPVMVNKKTIKAQTKLVLFLAPQKKAV